ncbi:unnamed protein product, partial [Allacma fusca]
SVQNIFLLTTCRSGPSFFGEEIASHFAIFYHYKSLLYFFFECAGQKCCGLLSSTGGEEEELSMRDGSVFRSSARTNPSISDNVFFGVSYPKIELLNSGTDY